MWSRINFEQLPAVLTVFSSGFTTFYYPRRVWSLNKLPLDPSPLPSNLFCFLIIARRRKTDTLVECVTFLGRCVLFTERRCGVRWSHSAASPWTWVGSVFVLVKNSAWQFGHHRGGGHYMLLPSSLADLLREKSICWWLWISKLLEAT